MIGPDEPRLYVNDIFYSLQGEGVRAGTPNVFVRLSGCNLQCSGTVVDQAYQPLCDTEFVSQRPMGYSAIVARCKQLSPDCRWMILTGGEPTLQVHRGVADYFHDAGYLLAIETNGTQNVDHLGLDWICVSPKVAEHALKQRTAHEVKYVRAYGQGIPKTQVEADHYVLSPAWNGDHLDKETLTWCLQLARDNPPWRVSMQLHKLWAIR